MKAHILIVEDEAILYERLRMVLGNVHYTFDKYTKSVEEAIGQIHKKRPDLVLLDIDLEGDISGLELGERLNREFRIPFIYITQYDDDETFYKGLSTNHEDFVVKTKPHLDDKELLRKIKTVLNRNKKSGFEKEGVLGLKKYLDEIKAISHTKEITKVPVRYEEITYFTTFHNKQNNKKIESLRANYLIFKTIDSEEYYLPTSLRELQVKLPYYFCRVNDKTIVNLSRNIFNGRINGSRLVISGEEFTITQTYKKEVQKRIEFLYES